jgi:hypothetical protein
MVTIMMEMEYVKSVNIIAHNVPLSTNALVVKVKDYQTFLIVVVPLELMIMALMLYALVFK